MYLHVYVDMGQMYWSWNDSIESAFEERDEVIEDGVPRRYTQIFCTETGEHF